MSLVYDANAPVRFKGQSYKALTLADVAALIESLPKHLVPRQYIPFVTVTDAMKFARSPYGLTILMDMVSEGSGHTHAKKMSPGEQLELASALTDRFYGFDAADPDQQPGSDGDAGEPEPFPQGPASLPTSPA